jgi:hypothetical protein
MSNKNLFYGNWKTYLEKQKLNEVTEDAYEQIVRATEVAETKPQLLPFKSIFGDKLRITQPLVQKNVKKIIAVLSFILEENPPQHKPDYSSIVQTKFVPEKKVVLMKQKPLGWVEGQPIPEVSKEIIDIVVEIPKVSKNPKTNESTFKILRTNVIGAIKEGVKYLKTKKERELPQSWDEQSKKEFLASFDRLIELANKMQQWWQKNQARFILDPELLATAVRNVNENLISSYEFETLQDDKMGEMSNEYSIIYSRAPIDVLRMSDFMDEGLESCHSQGNSYFNCAIAEAQNEGAIAYVVKTEDLENVNLEDTEIFSDPQRRVKGIRPISRIRLRNVYDENNNNTIAVPEQRVYGERIDGFMAAIDDFVVETQSDMLITTDEQGNKKLNLSSNDSDFAHRGGSYSDAPGIAKNFLKFLENLVKVGKVEFSDEQKEFIKSIKEKYVSFKNVSTERDYRRFIEDEEDDEEEFQREQAENQFSRGVHRVRAHTPLLNDCNFEWQYGEGYPIIDASFYLQYEYGVDIFTDEYSNVPFESVGQSILDILVNKDREIFIYPDMSLEEVSLWLNKESKTVYLSIIYKESMNDSEEFSSRCNDLVRWVQKYGGDSGLESEFDKIMKTFGIFKGDSKEAPGIALERLKVWANNSSKHLTADVVGNFTRFNFKPKQQFSFSGNQNAWLIGNLTYDEIRKLTVTKDTENVKEIIIPHYVLMTLKADLQLKLENLLFRRIARAQQIPLFTNKFTPENDIFELLIPDVELEILPKQSYRELKTGTEESWQVYATISFKFNLTSNRTRVKQLENFLAEIDEDPNVVLENMYKAFREVIGRNLQERKHTQKTVLTETKKTIIKERLMNWYRKNRGSR